MKKIFLYLIIIILTSSCSYSIKEEGLCSIKYIDDSNEKIKQIDTFFNGIVYINDKKKAYKILANSSIEFNENDNFNLKKGILLVVDKKLRNRINCNKSHIEEKIFFDNQQGKCQFYRLRLPSWSGEVYADVKIEYNVDLATKIINTKLHFIYKYGNFKYYGFFIPLSVYWNAQKYLINIDINTNKNLIVKIITEHKVGDKKDERQVVYFRRKKSKELVTTDMKEFKKEKKIRKNIWSENNPDIFFNNIFEYPLEEIKYISSNFGLIREWRLSNGRIFFSSIHLGVDFAQLEGTPVYAPCEGIIRYAQMGELVGNTIIIEHGLSFYTDYSHLNELLVNPGEIVNKGDIIATVGATGAATGPHLHWGARVNGIPVDPRSFLGIEEIFIP